MSLPKWLNRLPILTKSITKLHINFFCLFQILFVQIFINTISIALIDIGLPFSFSFITMLFQSIYYLFFHFLVCYLF